MDRNDAMQVIVIVMDTSLSARRAWIEIIDDFEPSSTRKVALRKESVDRNHQVCQFTCARRLSLSARRAWIEIEAPSSAPYAELSRSPQGERG